MDDASDFTLSGPAWDSICVELAAIGRSPSGGDRWSLEFMIDAFVRAQAYPRRPPRAKLSAQWARVFTATKQLEAAIKQIEDEPTAADLSLLGWVKGDGFDLPALRAGIADLGERAQFISYIESEGPQSANASKEMQDWLIRGLCAFWTARGGTLGVSTSPDTGERGGPLMRFMATTLNSALEAAQRPPLTKEGLRAVIRKIKARRQEG